MIIPLNNSISASVIDYDAREFVNVCGITQSSEIRGINDCFRELKSADLWDRIFYGFAMVWAGTSQSMLIDIKSRQSLSTVTPTSGLSSSATFSSTGIKYNGGEYHAILGSPLSSYINTDSRPGHISIYNRTDYISLGLTAISKHGHLEPFTNYEQSISFSNNGVSASLWNGNGPMSFTVSNTSGFFVFSNVDDNNEQVASLLSPYTFYLSRNGQIIGSQSSIFNYHAYGSNICIGAFSDNIIQPSVRSIDEICWYSIGEGLGENSTTGRHIDIYQQERFYEIIQKLQTILNR
jgi:hypothetical protein